MNIPTNLLENKKILLALSGSIAVYKSLELVREFVKAGADVRVIMSESAKKFVTPLTFETLTSNRVLDDTNESWVSDHNHIKISEWADVLVIAPATANTIAKLSNAIADNILLQATLAFSGIKIIAPSANTNMLENPITQENLKRLTNTNYTIVNTQVKELACKTVGNGAMADYMSIFHATARELLKDSFWLGRRVTVTGGGTREKIDDVRYLSNFSSGKMAASMATALYLKGAEVSLISTKPQSNLPLEINTFDVEDTQEMLECLSDSIIISKATLSCSDTVKPIHKKPYLFMAAAVSDYVPESVESGKLKKDKLGDAWQLPLKKNIDILNSIDKEGISVIGFKAEMDALNATKNATNMLNTKRLDAVCLNVLKDSSSFGTDSNAVDFITASQTTSIPRADKLTIAFEILKNAKKLQEQT
ncbi:bifunctional phosphopantothenoylcysteine decarboxylase/phosphopantothenate--cysteine ligase CoaBC [Sulfurimonas aquatica]|uniref:Coenzyme A biosynthesis bifunctional protein CoaBC n=1 Tax=Sulfurimonas aquatica TaxID=2672570 RepID=A0A975AZX1_9BACT|nr:bifunctional phosphopantothenoylcysteine decarboxylase/phosphopantothenate--cysteine ligase CoaBC [Sulfurimonas aquatica]QSZ41672.1 bifunctional phosphopantothenoylcysteine decarboxylase/phosphopantothenate--cysteine ligase CoaBC [Sulfurimonas aquatica]